MADVKETRAARLDRLLKIFLPSVKLGEWGKAGSPYTFSTLDDGRQRLTLTNRETGDRIGVVGTNRDELLDKLEARLKGGQ